MQDPSGLLAPSLRVFPLFVVGRERRAAPQRQEGLWPQTCAGGLNYDPPPCDYKPEGPSRERLPAQCRKGSVAPLVERFEATLPLYAPGPTTAVFEL